MSSELQRLGRAVAKAQDAALARTASPTLDLRFAEPPARVFMPRTVVAWGCALAALLLGMAWLLRPQGVASIGFRVGAEQSVSHELRWLEASAYEPLDVHFSDGSHVQLSARGRLRVVKLDERGAGLQLESGKLTLRVHHREQTQWNVDAGPFGVRVVGTRFHVAWEPAGGTLQLQLTEGAVELTGPIIDKRRVAAGEQVTVSLRERQANVQQPTEALGGVNRESTPTAASPEVEAAPQDAPSPPRAPRRKARSVTVDAQQDAPPPVASFEELARAGRYAEAVQRVRGSAWQPTLESASASSLSLLADAARLSGHVAQAEQVYTRIRSRFAGSREAASAAFALGRLHFDQRHDPRAAASWFSTYLREASHGPLACEAEARLMEALRAAGEMSEARNSAASYLRRCPAGPHVPLARRLLGSASH